MLQFNKTLLLYSILSGYALRNNLLIICQHYAFGEKLPIMLKIMLANG